MNVWELGVRRCLPGMMWSEYTAAQGDGSKGTHATALLSRMRPWQQVVRRDPATPILALGPRHEETEKIVGPVHEIPRRHAAPGPRPRIGRLPTVRHAACASAPADCGNANGQKFASSFNFCREADPAPAVCPPTRQTLSPPLTKSPCL